MIQQQCAAATVIDILHKKVGVPLDTPNLETASWEELGVESLGLTETFSSLEQLLDIWLPHEEALQTQNVQELVSFINSLRP